ncbi:hypothetical protein Xvie_03614 [Xenorhabdus vietnamensis]|uniref:Uncharacterized protein n=1 Tax=Xenorhabdus vietnamensis TaxID=351656 RepID=A0A1Y2S7C0_9GAMM|nr:hypothetical protein [Xenorhabdus vietnamensis]OTA14523.1 hypothetical protein Xvie_03614 [Xenorhabdus vietnamensis]
MRVASLSAHIPSSRISVQSLAEISGCSPMEAKVFSRLFGIDSVSAHSDREPPLHAMQTVIKESLRDLGSPAIDTLIYVHAFPVQSADNQSRIAELIDTIPALQSVRHSYEVDQHNCAGGFWGLSMAQSLLAQGVAERIVILIGDSFHSLNPEHRYVAGCTMMADGYASLVVDRLPGPWQIESIYTHHDSQYHQGLFGDEQQNQAFYRAHDTLVNEALEALDDPQRPHTAILPHNINRVSWFNYTRSFPETGQRLDLSLLPDIGHCCAADPFLLMNRHFQDPADQSQRWALLSVGSGGYVGACSIAYTPDH